MSRPIGVHDLTIRSEIDEDRGAIAATVAAAFGSDAEADLVCAIRSSPEYIPELSLVAVVGGEIVGHVMVSHTELRDGDHRHRICHLSPLAVAPSYQGQGIGSSLVRAVTAAARDMGVSFVVLEGDPNYYGRLGFEPSAPRASRSTSHPGHHPRRRRSLSFATTTRRFAAESSTPPPLTQSPTGNPTRRCRTRLVSCGKRQRAPGSPRDDRTDRYRSSTLDKNRREPSFRAD